MVPKLHAKGRSFRGAAAYLLHDKGRAKTAHRVAWSETRNLATDDPEIGWRIMAATAMDQERLKARAGVKNTGRKSADSVLHLTLSWHPDEKATLSREEMIRAALGALRALKADDRQALFVCHDDEPQPHLHVLLNRVSSEDGRMLSSSKEKLELSRWAEAYEKERGRVLCEERVLNNAARRRREFVRGKADQSRHLLEQQAANSNQPPPAAVRDEQKRKDAAVAKKTREIKARHIKAMMELGQKHRQHLAGIRARARRDVVLARSAVREKYRPEWKANFHVDLIEKAEFDEKERGFVGRVQNALKAIDFGSIVKSGDRRRALGEAFQVFAHAGARLEALRRSQAARAREIAGRQRREELAAAVVVRQISATAQTRARDTFLKERQTLDMSRAMDAAAQRAAWKTRQEERSRAWSRSQGQTERTTEQAPGPAATKAADLIPQDAKAAERARMIDQIKKRMREKDQSRDNDRER